MTFLIGAWWLQSKVFIVFHPKKRTQLHLISKAFVVLFLLSKASPALASAQKCPSPAAAPNIKNVKQMLLDWCRAKTEPYEVNMPYVFLSVNYCPMELNIALPLTFHSLSLFLLNWNNSGSEHPKLLLKLEGRHSLLRLGAPLLPRCVRVLHPKSHQAQGKLWVGLQHRRVSRLPLYEEAAASCLIHSPALSCSSKQSYLSKFVSSGFVSVSVCRRLAGCPPLLDPDDLIRMKEPDWKCVYTYIQEFYRCLVEKGLVKTKKWLLTQKGFDNQLWFYNSHNQHAQAEIKKIIPSTFLHFVWVDITYVMCLAYVNAQCLMWSLCVVVLERTLALSGQLAPGINAFLWDYTSALIPVTAMETLGTHFYHDAVEGLRVWVLKNAFNKNLSIIHLVLLLFLNSWWLNLIVL